MAVMNDVEQDPTTLLLPAEERGHEHELPAVEDGAVQPPVARPCAAPELAGDQRQRYAQHRRRDAEVRVSCPRHQLSQPGRIGKGLVAAPPGVGKLGELRREEHGILAGPCAGGGKHGGRPREPEERTESAAGRRGAVHTSACRSEIHQAQDADDQCGQRIGVEGGRECRAEQQPGSGPRA